MQNVRLSEKQEMASGFLEELNQVAMVQASELLARHTTFHIGGPADWYVVVRDALQLRNAVAVARRHNVPVFILSGGSNILVSDAGIRGLVIDNRAQAVEIQRTRPGGPHTVSAESGTPTATLARLTAKEGLAGLEWAVGIPGTVGGVVIFNAGAHGHTIAEVLTSVEVLTADGRVQRLSPAELNLGYRESLFSKTHRDAVILRATFSLREGEPAELQRLMDQYNEHRKTTQPAKASAGSVFKNPSGKYAGQLIEAAGLKGHRIGQAQISERHANFIVNLGGASADDVQQLIQLARERVRSSSGVELELEIRLVGEWPETVGAER